MVLEYNLPKYSPIIPMANSCAPEKIAMIDAKNVKPGTAPPLVKYLIKTYIRTTTPNRMDRNPIPLET